MPLPVIRWSLCVALALTMAGCSTTSRRPLLGWRQPAAPAEKTESTAKAEPEKVAPEKVAQKDPLRTSAERAADAKKADAAKSAEAAKTADKAAVPKAEVAAAKDAAPAAKTPDPAKPATPAADAPKDKPAALAGFNAETLALIDKELQDTSDEERIYWFDQLKRVDQSVVPQILQARRLSMKLAEQRSGTPGGIQLAGGAAPNADMPVWAGGAASAAAPAPNAAVLNPPAPSGLVNTTATAAPAEGPWGHSSQPLPGEAARQAASANPGLGTVNPWSVGQNAAPSRVVHAAVEAPEGAAGRVEHALAQVAEGDRGTRADTAFYRVDPLQKPAIEQQSYNTAPAGPALRPPADDLPGNQAAARTSAPARAPFGATQTPVVSTTASYPPAENPVLWKEQVEQLINHAEQELATLKPGATPEERQNYIRRHVYLRLLYIMAQHQERALTAIPGVDPADQEFWQQTFWAMSNYFDEAQIPEARDRATQTITQLNTAVRRLQEKANLELRNVSFCRQISYFGNYEKFPRDEFRPGQEVLVYAEIDNFKSELAADGQYRTLLRSRIDILSPSGEQRHQIEFPGTEDLCRNHRRDYFHNYQFTIPDKIPLGPHVLKLSVFDELSGRVTTTTVNFLIK